MTNEPKTGIKRLVDSIFPGIYERREARRLEANLSIENAKYDKAVISIRKENLETVRASAVTGGGYTTANSADDKMPVPKNSGSQDNLVTDQNAFDIRSKSRHVCSNMPLPAGLLQTGADNIVGSGAIVQATTDSDSWNDLAEKYWAWYSDNKMDIRGIQTWAEFCRLALMSMWRDGDIGFRMVNGQLQPIESDRIAQASGNVNPNIYQGVEVDNAGVPIKYWIANQFPSSTYVPSASPVDPEEFIFLYRPTRFSSSRGTPIFNSSIDSFARIDAYQQSVLNTALMASLLGVIRSKGTRNLGLAGSGIGSETNADTARSNLKWDLQPIMFLDDTDSSEYTTVKPEQPTTNYTEYIISLVQFASRPIGLPIEMALLDYRRGSYSAARQGMIEARRMFEGWQRYLERNFYNRAYIYAIGNAIERGDLPKNEQFKSHEWHHNRWPWIDPLKDAQGKVALYDANLASLSDNISEQGKDWRSVLKQKQIELREIKRLGLPLPDGSDPILIDKE